MSDLNDIKSISFSKPLAKTFLREHINSRWLKRPQNSKEYNVEDQTFHNNSQFWGTVLHSPSFLGLRNVTLVNFQIIDWYPRSPGYAFTRKASEARKTAAIFLEEGSEDTYTPTGKEYMLEGGIGSYRFYPFIYQGIKYYLCSATTDQFCHTGVPLAIPEQLIENIDFSKLHNIHGCYQEIPDPIRGYFKHLFHVPMFYFLVENVIPKQNADAPIFINPIVFMRGNNGENMVSYCTCRADQDGALENAAEWLAGYAHRYDAKIITNYDEQLPFFSEAYFSLQHISTDEINLLKLKEFGIPLSQIFMNWEIVMNKTDKSKNISVIGNNNQNIVITDTIKNSFNQIQTSNTSGEIKVLLTDLVTKVEGLCKVLPDEEAQTIKQDLETFTKEATNEKPRQNMLEISLESIKKAAENVRDIGGPILEIVVKLTPLLLTISQQPH